MKEQSCTHIKWTQRDFQIILYALIDNNKCIAKLTLHGI